MKRSERERPACYLGCGNQRAPGNKYNLCQVCDDLMRDIETAAARRRVLLTAPREPLPGFCTHVGCEMLAAVGETAPCDRYCVAHCVTHDAKHKCRRTIMRHARARYRERQRVA